MKRSTRPITLAAACVAAATASLTGCSSTSSTVAENCTPAHQFSTIDGGKLTVAVPTFPPFSALDGKAASGVDGDLINKFAAQECLDVVTQTVNYSAAVPAIQNGRADVAIGSFYRTQARADVVGLSGPVYLDQMGLISKDGVTSIPALTGRRVGAIDGYLWVEDLNKVLGGDLKLYPSSLELQQDIKAGRIDVGVDGLGAALAAFKDTDYKVTIADPDPAVAASVEAGQTGFPFTKDNAELGSALDETVAAWHQDGTIKEALRKWGLPESSADVGQPRLLN